MNGSARDVRHVTWWSYAAIVVVCLAVGLPTIRSDNYFLGDDFGLVHHLHDLPADRLLSYFASDWTEGIYGHQLDELRPFLAFSYWLDAHLFGSTNVSGYHTTNLVLHLLNTLLVLAIARSIAPAEPALAALAALLFALMPSHAEPVAWISGRVDSLAGLFYLGAFLCFARFRRANRHAWLLAALLIFIGGLFAKQSIVTFPAVILAFDMLMPGSRAAAGGRSFARLWPHLLFFALAVMYLALRHVLFGNAVREDILTPAMLAEFFFRQNRYLRELLPTPNGAPRAMMVAAEVLTIGILAVCARWLVARGQAGLPVARRLAFFGAAWYAITIAPMVVTYLSARHLYLTVAGVSITIASLVFSGPRGEAQGRPRIRMAMAGALIVLYAVASTWNVSTWVTMGTESGTFASAVPRLLQSVPRGSIVFLDVPEWHRDGWFWSWATPFALQPPFASDDLYERFKIVERAPVYCCPPDQWWAARKATLMALMDSPVPQQVTSIVFAQENPGGPLFTTRIIDGGVLKGRIETALGKPVESLSTGITPEEAQALSRVLFE
ncbi:MAG TPA: hypothetical protein VFS23_07200 [Vicinamibacterales bacterium]|nr:hypothetical protein [Vicinamibacterales bacterium]